MPAHHNADAYLHEYIAAAGIADQKNGPLFRSLSRGPGRPLGLRRLSRTEAIAMVRRRARQAGIATQIGCHTFRATGITTYLLNGGSLEHAQQIAAHESPRTTKLYDRTRDEITLDEIEGLIPGSDHRKRPRSQRKHPPGDWILALRTRFLPPKSSRKPLATRGGTRRRRTGFPKRVPQVPQGHPPFRRCESFLKSGGCGRLLLRRFPPGDGCPR